VRNIETYQRIKSFPRPEVAGGCQQLEVQTGAIFELNQCLGCLGTAGKMMVLVEKWKKWWFETFETCKLCKLLENIVTWWFSHASTWKLGVFAATSMGF
jgi:hypothetical protein